MATLENGYTRVANELLKMIYSTNFTATEFKILLLIIRFTYGYGKKSTDLSLTYISKGIGVSKRYVSSSLSKLIEDKVVIVVREHTDTQSRIIGINNHCEQWENRSTVQQVKQSSTGEVKRNTTDEAEFNTTDEAEFHQEKKTLNKTLNKVDSDFHEPEKLKKESDNKTNSATYKEIIDYLNLKAGTRYRPNTKATQKHINARLNEGFTLDDFKTVIDAKANDWLSDKKMSIYLRPETLFGTKFESYLNQGQINGNNSDEIIANDDGSFSLR